MINRSHKPSNFSSSSRNHFHPAFFARSDVVDTRNFRDNRPRSNMKKSTHHCDLNPIDRPNKIDVEPRVRYNICRARIFDKRAIIVVMGFALSILFNTFYPSTSQYTYSSVLLPFFSRFNLENHIFNLATISPFCSTFGLCVHSSSEKSTSATAAFLETPSLTYNPQHEKRLTDIEDRIRYLIPQDRGQDQALLAAGATILKEYTTNHGNSHKALGWRGWLVSHFMAFGTAEVVLERYVDIGECWLVNANSGTVGVRLARDSTIGSFVIDDIHSDHLDSYGSSMTVQNFTLWLVVNPEAVKELDSKAIVGSSLLNLTEPPSCARNLCSKHSGSFLKVAQGQYEAAGEMRQRYTIDKRVQELNLPFRDIVFDFHSNWGAEHTRICHIGLYGSRW